jgi:hypothetical protein
VLGDGGVLAVAAAPQMDGDPLALAKNFDGCPGQSRLDLFSGVPIRNTVVMAVDVDVIVDADPAGAPLGKDVGLDRQGLQGRNLLSSPVPGRSSSSCSCRRVTPSRRIGRSSFSRTSSAPIASFTSARL